MKKALIIFALAAMLVGCGGDVVNGVTYDSYGIVNEQSQKNPNINYEISVGSVIWGIILCETIVVPIYIIGWDLMTPVSSMNVDPAKKGVISQTINGNTYSIDYIVLPTNIVRVEGLDVLVRTLKGNA